MKEKNEKQIHFIGCYNKSVILTYVGVILSFFGMLKANTNINLSYNLLILAGICDLFDGAIARKCKRTDIEKEFGVQIDSLADVVSFVLFPSIILTATVDYKFVNLVVLMYMLCGVIRLAWFNINTSIDKTTTHFIGLPVTYVALIIPTIEIILRLLSLTEPFVGSAVYMITYVIIAIMFIMNINIKKPRGIWYIVFGALAVFLIALIWLV